MTPSLRLIAALVLCDAFVTNLRGQAKAGVPSEKADRIDDAEVRADGTVRIWLKSGKSIQPPPDPEQAECEKLLFADDGLTVGWLVAQYVGASYPIAIGLDIYRLGKPMRHFSDGLMLLDWEFLDGDKHVQFSSTQAHGPGVDWHTMEIYDIETGRLLKMWTEPTDRWVVEATFGPVRGRAADAAGKPLQAVVVTMRSDPRAEALALIPTTERGQFEIPTVFPGSYELRFEHRGFQTLVTKITMNSAGDALDVGTVTLSPLPRR